MPDLRSSIENIRRELRPDVLALGEAAQYAIDGVEPLARARPATTDELAGLLRLAGERGVPVAPYGRGHFAHLGQVPSRIGILICLDQLDSLIAYEPADLTVTVQAGMTLAALQQHLAERDQCLPVDPLCPDDATIGGVVAANASGPSRFRHGTWSDMLLGVRAVAASGETLSAGGRVVKNVAGYDLTRLLVGSFGTLAVLTELTFKVSPRPAARLMVLGRCESRELAQEAASHLIQSQLEPTFVELLNANALVGRRPSSRAPRGAGLPAPDARPAPHAAAIVAGFAGAEPDVAYQRAEAESLLRSVGMETQSLDGEAEAAARPWLRSIVRRVGTGPNALVTMKLSVLSSQVGTAIARAERLAADFDWRCAAQAHAGNGIVYVMLQAPSPTDEPPERVAGLCDELRQEAERLGGWAVIERAPAQVKQLAGVWGNAGYHHRLVASIKKAFDPGGILNPGRLMNAR